MHRTVGSNIMGSSHCSLRCSCWLSVVVAFTTSIGGRLLLFSASAAAAAAAAATTATAHDEYNYYYNYYKLLSSPVRNQFDWIFNYLNSDHAREMDEIQYQDRFTASFRGVVSFETFQQGARDYKRQNTTDPWEVVSVAASTPNAASIILSRGTTTKTKEDSQEEVTREDEMIVLALSVDTDDGDDDDDDDKISGVRIIPYEFPALDNQLITIEDAATRLEQLLGRNHNHQFAYIVADIDDDDDSCRLLAGRDHDKPIPIGSMFKLYVLGAVVDAIETNNGTISSWEDEIEIEEGYFSLPTGIVQGDIPGSTNRTVRELAELMVAISDNTAADHLMAKVAGGRSAIERAMINYGHRNPELNIPFLSTREFFLLKLLDKADGDKMPGPVGMAYIEASSTNERYEVLSNDLKNATVRSLNVSLWTQPIAVESIGWFASPLDLCNVLVGLQRSSVAREILSINPGIFDTQKLWSYIGFKGGSEPGLIGLSWYVEALDDDELLRRRRVVAGGLWNSDKVLSIEDAAEASLLFGSIRDSSLLDCVGQSEKTPIPTGAPTSMSEALPYTQPIWLALLLPLAIYLVS